MFESKASLPKTESSPSTAPLLFEDDIVWDSFVKKAYTPLSEREKKDVRKIVVFPNSQNYLLTFPQS